MAEISHLCRCEELVNSYLSDNDPDAVLAVGADVRKIQYCFMLLKVNSLSHFTESRLDMFIVLV